MELPSKEKKNEKEKSKSSSSFMSRLPSFSLPFKNPFSNKVAEPSSDPTISSYTIKEKKNDILIHAGIVKQPNRILIIDKTVSSKKIGKISGSITYEKFEEGTNTLEIKNFMVNPAALGLGTLLMFELVKYANQAGYKKIIVPNAAISAMEVYANIFGGKAYYEERYNMVLGTPIMERQYNGLLNQEAEEIGEAAKKSHLYFNQDAELKVQEEVERKAIQGHLEKHPFSNKESFDRMQKFVALSASWVVYETGELFSKLKDRVENKWKQTE